MTSRNTALKLATLILAWLSLGVLVALAVRGLLNPQAGSAAFGLPVQDASGAFYHAVYRDRNLVIALLGIAYLVASMWRAFAILATVAVTLPVYDIVALKRASVPVVPVHYVTLTMLLILAVLAWLEVRSRAIEQRPRERRAVSGEQ